MKDINIKIEKIDKLLEDDDYLNEYIRSLDKKDIKVSKDLKTKITNRLEKRGKKISYINVLKIAACTIFAVTICECSILFEKQRPEVVKEDKISSVYSAIMVKLNDINEMMLSPIVFERGENK